MWSAHFNLTTWDDPPNRRTMPSGGLADTGASEQTNLSLAKAIWTPQKNIFQWIGFREIYRKPCGCSIPIMNPLMLRSLLLSLWTHGLHFSAQLCLGGRPSLSTTSLEIMGYTDWYTPNIVELRKKWWMMNLRKSTIPPFTQFYQFGDSEAQKSGVPYIVVRCREIIT